MACRCCAADDSLGCDHRWAPAFFACTWPYPPDSCHPIPVVDFIFELVFFTSRAPAVPVFASPDASMIAGSCVLCPVSRPTSTKSQAGQRFSCWWSSLALFSEAEAVLPTWEPETWGPERACKAGTRKEAAHLDRVSTDHLHAAHWPALQEKKHKSMMSNVRLSSGCGPSAISIKHMDVGVWLTARPPHAPITRFAPVRLITHPSMISSHISLSSPQRLLVVSQVSAWALALGLASQAVLGSALTCHSSSVVCSAVMYAT